MNFLIKNFLRGLVIVVPIAVTVYVFYAIFTKIDQLLGLPVRGVGFLVTILLVILIGVLTGNIFVKRAFHLMERVFTKAPFVKTVYSAIKDLIEALVGDKKSFNKPVMVLLYPEADARVLGFITREDLSALGLLDHVAVYFPQSYAFAGRLLLVARDRVIPVGTDASRTLAFIVSGGVSGL